jgi:hypothetical protein
MQKRFVLLVLGVAMVLGAFLAYQFVSGASTMGRPKKAVATTGPATTLPMAYESRDEFGQLEYLITATRAEPIKDTTGNPLPGQFQLIGPIATFYDKTGRTVEVRGDTCRIAFDQTIRPNSSGSGTLLTGGPGSGAATTRMLAALRSGQLSGHVRLTISARPEGAPPVGNEEERKFTEGELKIHFDGDLQFDGTQEILTSPGNIYIRSGGVLFTSGRAAYSLTAQD